MNSVESEYFTFFTINCIPFRKYKFQHWNTYLLMKANILSHIGIAEQTKSRGSHHNLNERDYILQVNVVKNGFLGFFWKLSYLELFQGAAHYSRNNSKIF